MTPDRAPGRLEGWKQIAGFFGKADRTVQNWEKHFGLPVRRDPTGAVYADVLELKKWQASAPVGEVLEREPRTRNRKLYWLAAGMLLAIAGAFLWLPRVWRGPGAASSRPVAFQVGYDTLTVSDADGRPLWSKRFPSSLWPDFYHGMGKQDRPPVWIGNLDHDPGIETLFLYYPASREKTGTALICFNERGDEKWRFQPGVPVATASQQFSPLHIATTFAVAPFQPGDGPRILITSHHLFEHPNRFVVLDSDGMLLNQYWHSGHLEHLDVGDLEGDGVPEILLGGVNNAENAATVVVLDPANVYGASVPRQKQDYRFPGLAAAREKAVILFPRSCINRRFERFNKVRLLSVAGGTLRVNVQERDGDGECEAIYTFDGSLRPTGVVLSVRYQNLHLEMENRGELKHSFTDAEVTALEDVRVLRP